MRIDPQLPAKVLKRVSQLRRLGAGGLVRTAYVRALGPAVYSLTDPARSIAAALHRQSAISRALPRRLESLKERSAIDVQGGRPGISIEFGADVGRFVQTLEAVLDLYAAGCPVPHVVAVDWKSHTIVLAQMIGESFNDESRRTTWSNDTITHLESALAAIHRAGYVLGDIDQDCVLLDKDGLPVIVGLRCAIPLAGLSRDMSVYLRDADRRNFNEIFGTRLLTAGQLRNLLSPNAAIPTDKVHGCFSEVYAPVVIRDDIRWGKIWNTDLGTGRWNFIMKEHLPIPIHGSVLDLGSNNGFNPLQMLRAGAASAVGVEIDADAIGQAMFLRRAYEWLDNRAYDFRCIHGSQADLPSFNLPRFDLVTAFCSLYYLQDAEIRRLARYIRTRTDTLVLQCNTDRLIDRGGNEETYRKASVDYAVEVLEQAGFIDRQIVSPPGYSRPLVIGRVRSLL